MKMRTPKSPAMNTTTMSEIPTQGGNPATCTMFIKMNPIKIPSASKTTNWALRPSRRMLQVSRMIPAVAAAKISANAISRDRIICATR